MNPETKKNTRDVLILTAAAALLAGFCYLHEYRTLKGIGPTLDDTFIHLQFSWNIAHGHGFSFNPGEPMPGSTSPLWVMLLVPAAFSDKEFLVNASLALSTLSYLATVILAWLLARRLGFKRGAALVAGGLVLTNGRLLWAGASGMETDLFAALSLAALIVLLHEQKAEKMSWKSGTLFGLATLARPEGYLLFTIAIGHYLISRAVRNKKFDPGELARSLPWSAILVFAALVLPYIVFCLVTIHHPLPSTFVAKHADLARFRLSYPEWSARYLWMDNPVAAIFFALALVRTALMAGKNKLKFIASGDGLVASWSIGYLIVSEIVAPMPYHFCRYQIPLLPFFMLMAVRTAQDIIDLAYSALAGKDGGQEAKGPKKSLAIQGAAVAIFLALVLPGAVLVTRWTGGVNPTWPGVITISAKNIREMHVAAGQWLGRATSEGTTIATMDIGAIGYYSERVIIDIQGLVTPEIVPSIKGKGVTERRSRAILEFLRKERVEYLAVFPQAFPGLVDDESIFKPLTEIKLDDNQISSHDWMVIYKCFWDKNKFSTRATKQPGQQ